MSSWSERGRPAPWRPPCSHGRARACGFSIARCFRATSCVATPSIQAHLPSCGVSTWPGRLKRPAFKSTACSSLVPAWPSKAAIPTVFTAARCCGVTSIGRSCNRRSRPALSSSRLFRCVERIPDQSGGKKTVTGVDVGVNGRERTLRASVTIAADGRRLTLAFSLGLARHPPAPRRWGYRGDYEGASGLSSGRCTSTGQTMSASPRYPEDRRMYAS